MKKGTNVGKHIQYHLLQTPYSNKLIKCSKMSVWIFIIHSCELVGTNQIEEGCLHFYMSSGSKHHYAREMSWPLLHGIVPQNSSRWRRWWSSFPFSHIPFLIYLNISVRAGGRFFFCSLLWVSTRGLSNN